MGGDGGRGQGRAPTRMLQALAAQVREDLAEVLVHDLPGVDPAFDESIE